MPTPVSPSNTSLHRDQLVFAGSSRHIIALTENELFAGQKLQKVHMQRVPNPRWFLPMGQSLLNRCGTIFASRLFASLSPRASLAGRLAARSRLHHEGLEKLSQPCTARQDHALLSFCVRKSETRYSYNFLYGSSIDRVSERRELKPPASEQI